MDDPPVTRRRWTAFSLRTVMIVVTVGAIASWMYWTAWPRWKIYRQQMAVESGAKQLKVGSTAMQGMQLLGGKRLAPTSFTSTWPLGRKMYGRTDYVWRNAIYCILYTYPEGYSGPLSSAPCESVALYRLAPPKNLEVNWQPNISEQETWALNHPQLSNYLRDFSWHALVQDEAAKSNIPRVEFELLYSDTPVTNEFLASLRAAKLSNDARD
jgi:hypothetical protein